MNVQPMQARLQRRTLLLAALAVGAAGRRAAAQAPAADDPWPSLAMQIFAGRPVQDGNGIVAIDAPYRAEDAALVPVGLHSLLPDDDQRHVRSITLVIDANPSPLAAVFSPGPASGMRSLSTRVRIDDYTKVHAVAELSDGQLYAAARFVKAAGGCSAPAAKLDADAIPLGTMRFRQFPVADGAAPGPHEAQLLIRHPNYTGMQMDQVDPALCAGAFCQQGAHLAGRRPAADDRQRHFNLGEPGLPVRLPAKRGRQLPRRNG